MDNICPECGGKRGFHMEKCAAPDREKDAYIQRMRNVRMRLEAVGINPDDLLEFVEFSSRQTNFG